MGSTADYSALYKEGKGILIDAAYPRDTVEVLFCPFWPKLRLSHVEEELSRGLLAYSKGGLESLMKESMKLRIALPENRRRYRAA